MAACSTILHNPRSASCPPSPFLLPTLSGLYGPQLWARVDPCDGVTLPPPCPGLRGEGESSPAPPPANPLPIPQFSPGACWALRPNADGEDETRPNILQKFNLSSCAACSGSLTHHELPTWTVHVLIWCAYRTAGSTGRTSSINSSDLLVCTAHLRNMRASSRRPETACDGPKTPHAVCVPLRHYCIPVMMFHHVLGAMSQFPRVRQYFGLPYLHSQD